MNKYSNIAQTTLAAPIADSDTTLTVTNGSIFPSSGSFMICTCLVSNAAVISNYELMLVSSVEGNVFTVTRGQENTLAVAHTTGEAVANVLTAGILNAIAQVAFTGSYADLTNKPFIPASQAQSDWSEANNANADYIKNKPSIPVNTPVEYSGTALITNPIEYIGSATTTSGGVVFQLTDTGLSGGNPLFTASSILYIKAEVSDSTSSYNYTYALTNSNKTLTVTVTKSSTTGVIALLGISLLSAPVATPNGTTVNILVKGR